MKLTVVIRDPSPAIYMQEPPTHRSVQFTLTPEQEYRIKLRHVGTSGSAEHFEEIAMCFLEKEA